MKKIVFLFIILFSFTGCELISNSSQLENFITSIKNLNSNSKSFSYDVEKTISFNDSLDVFNSPDQGFYKPVYVTATTEGLTYSKDNFTSADSTEYFSLYHLRIDLSKFSKKVNSIEDLEITEKVLSDLDTLLNYIEENEFSVIIRFSYDSDFNGNSDLEPEKQVILSHIKSLSSILKKHYSCITSIESGLIGPWGEQHTSSILSDKNLIPDIVNEFFSSLDDVKIPVLVRKPEYIYLYIYKYILNKTINNSETLSLESINNYISTKDDSSFYLGIYNDGYLGSSTDYGTYTDRENETLWLSKQNSVLPFGGEIVLPEGITLYSNSVQTIKGSTSLVLYFDLGNTSEIETLQEMYKLNLSYLNYFWNDKIIDYWKRTAYNGIYEVSSYSEKTSYDFMKNHLGARFYISGLNYSFEDYYTKFLVTLKINNNGFSYLTKTKYFSIILENVNDNSITVYNNIQSYSNENKVSLLIEDQIAKGEYNFYIKLSDTNGSYPIRFANPDSWNSTLKANYISTIQFK